MNRSTLSYQQIISIATQLHNSASAMEDNLNNLKALFNKVGNDDVWSGTAAAATKDEFDKLSAKFPEFSQAIDDCYKYLQSVVETYKNVDASVMGQ